MGLALFSAVEAERNISISKKNQTTEKVVQTLPSISNNPLWWRNWRWTKPMETKSFLLFSQHTISWAIVQLCRYICEEAEVDKQISFLTIGF